jgi:hypothetical protein
MTEPFQVQLTSGQVTPGDDLAIPVPSGQLVTLHETIWNVVGPEGLVTRFRFIAPAINRDAGTVDFEAASIDLMYLCQEYALQKLSQSGPVPAQVIVSLADRPLPFGEAAPEATQYFEAFRIENGACIWEVF